LIVGGGAERQALENLARQRGAPVRFAGQTSEPEKFLAQMDIFALSSDTEQMPLSLLEAMAAGTPVVATRVGGNPEVVVDGDTGFLIDAESPESISERVVRLLQDKAQAARMGEREPPRREAILKRIRAFFGLAETS